MKLKFVLRIKCDCFQKKEIDRILTMSSCDDDDDWELELVEVESDPPIDFVDVFLNILNKNCYHLNEVGIQKKDMSIWIYYEYDQQCNMEFLPDQMKRLGENGIVLCISCWKSE